MHNEVLIEQIAVEVEKEFQSGVICMDFAKEVAKRYADKVSLDKQKLLERMHIELDLKYLSYPEGESPEDYPKRRMMGEGYIRAMKFVDSF